MASYDQLKKYQVDLRVMRQEEARAQGQIDAALAQLKKEFKVDTLEQAKELLQAKQAQRDRAEEQFTKALKKVGEINASINR